MKQNTPSLNEECSMPSSARRVGPAYLRLIVMLTNIETVHAVIEICP
jgi:hypothetical protein